MTVTVETIKDDERLGTKYELWDDIPEEFRKGAARIAAFQCLAELVGVLPFSEWIDRVPDFTRKQMLIAKVQDEVGHGHVMARVAEDLGISREQILREFVDGKSKLLNVFHFGFESWAEIGPAALLMNSAAIVQFQSLDKGNYLPYARALKKIEKEEAFHYHHAIDLTHETLTVGSPRQRTQVQEAFDTWMPRLLAYFGPPDSDTVTENKMYQLGLKVDSNDDLRKRWLDRIISTFQELGVETSHIVSKDEDGVWSYPDVDWEEMRVLLSEGGPRYEDWKAMVADSLERNEGYRSRFSVRS